jgi:hypothetical protein
MQFESRVAGIPCIISVTQIRVFKGEGYSAPSDLNARGWVESTFKVLDRRGRPAAWLERKLTDKTTQAINEMIAELS